jgi:hypothetical protein
MIDVAGDANIIVVRAHDHSWIAVLRDGTEVRAESSGRSEATFVVAAGRYEIESDGVVDEVRVETRELASLLTGDAPARLRLTSDAPDRHAVDGVGEIVADGASFCTVSVERLGADGKPAGTGQVFLRSTGGTLMDGRGKARIRAIRLRRGRATFRLVADEAPRLVTVYAFVEQDRGAELPIEFV